MRINFRRKYRKIHRAVLVAKETLRKQPNTERTALLLCHALEKGMGMPSVKVGFGKEKADRLVNHLKTLITEGKQDSYAVQESLAILKAYCDFQDQCHVEMGDIKTETIQLYQKYHRYCEGGYQILSYDGEFSQGSSIDYASFVNSRHSMRTYSQEAISRQELLGVMELAKRAPSACNRQPWKFYCSERAETNQKIMRAVPPQPFLEDIPYYGVVTVDTDMFSDEEIYQWFINGGIFLGYLGLAFHQKGIGSCIFQFPVFSKEAESLREAVQIPDHEAIIAIVGFGKYPDQAKCIRADRRPNEDVVVFR